MNPVEVQHMGYSMHDLTSWKPRYLSRHYQVVDMCQANYVCKLSLLSGSQQVSAIVTNSLVWNKIAWGQPLLSLALESCPNLWSSVAFVP